MDNIGNRIGILIESLGIKKVRFAERLNIDQSYVTQLTSGRRNPSDRTIADICREFSVREEWLRNGSGKMFLDFTESEFLKAATTLSDDDFVKSLIVEYCKLDEGSKHLFKNFILKLADSMREKDDKTMIGESININNGESAMEQIPNQMTVEEAEAAYIKSHSRNVRKTASPALNIIDGNTGKKSEVG